MSVDTKGMHGNRVKAMEMLAAALKGDGGNE